MSQAAVLGATRRASAGSGEASFLDPLRERAGCLQELILLCKEQRRRAGAGRRPRGPPPPRGCSRRRRCRRCPARRQIGGGSSRARLLIRQARDARTCPRRAARRGRSLRGRGCSFAGGGDGGGSRTPSSAPAAPQPSLPGPRGRVCSGDLLRAKGRSWLEAEGLRFYCKVIRGRQKVKEDKGRGLGPRAAQQECWPLLLPTGHQHQTPWLCLDSSRQFLINPRAVKI